MNVPYSDLPERSFWRHAVANKSLFDISEIWDPKFSIVKTQNIVTFGSCFAQHIGKALVQNGFNWLSTEHPPISLSAENAKKFNYNVFSARTGNIYTTTLLKQWVEWATGAQKVPDEVWEKDGKFFDPFRPNIESGGFSSQEEMVQSRNQTIASFKKAIEKAEIFVFTLGLTESWINSDFDYEYPMCPGTVAGEFDATKHKFVNQQFSQIITAMGQSMEMMRALNPKLKFLLTVSPVPLTATNSGKHVAVATMSSKSILRAVAGQLADNRGYVDYFPSYEIISSPISKGVFFEPNQRSVNPHGVKFVMENFFKCLDGTYNAPPESTPQQSKTNAEIKQQEIARITCEEELLDAFKR